MGTSIPWKDKTASTHRELKHPGKAVALRVSFPFEVQLQTSRR